MPKVSIITTTYKHEAFIAHTITSVLDQSFSDWELLIGDDSPDDATWNIIQQYVEKYPDKIRAWHHTTNKGIVGNMNFLLDQVSPGGEFVTFLEGDDLYFQDKISRCMDIFSQFPNAGLVYTNFSFVDECGNTCVQDGYGGTPPYENIEAPITLDMFLNNFYHGKYPNILSYSTGMIRRRILDDFSGKIPNTLQKKTTVVSDFDFYFRIIQKERIYAINEPLVGYRIHENNITKDDGRIIRDLESLMRIYIRDGIIPQQHASYIFSKIAILHSSNSILQGRKKESLKYIAQSLSYFPRFFWKNTLRNFIATLLPLKIISMFLPPR